MKRIIALGPSGTYCDVALRNYLKKINEDLIIDYYPSIFRISDYMDDDTLAIIPFENTLDGFVMESLDRIIEEELQILGQVKLGIDFCFVSNKKDLDKVNECYVQFKTYGQCLDFISKHNFTYMKTDSNVQSKELFERKGNTASAIIPMHLLKNMNVENVIYHIADSKHNETRFFIVKKGIDPILDENSYNASIVVFSKEDRKGLLYTILSVFHDSGINLKSILSRPSKKDLGNYNFFLECMLKKEEIPLLNDAVKKLEDMDFVVKILGIYNDL